MISIFLILIVLTQENSIFNEMRENLRTNLKTPTLINHSELIKKIEKIISKSSEFLDRLFPINNPPEDTIKMKFNLMELQSPLVYIIKKSMIDVVDATLDYLNNINHEEQIKIIRETPKGMRKVIEKIISQSRKFVEGLDIHDKSKEYIKINLMQLENQVKAIATTEMMNFYEYLIRMIEEIGFSPVLDVLRESQPFYISHNEL